MALPALEIINIGMAIFKKIKSKPKTGIKEATSVGIMSFAIALYDQYTIGGIQAIDPTTVAGIVSCTWVLGMRLYQKHKDD